MDVSHKENKSMLKTFSHIILTLMLLLGDEDDAVLDCFIIFGKQLEEWKGSFAIPVWMWTYRTHKSPSPPKKKKKNL